VSAAVVNGSALPGVREDTSSTTSGTITRKTVMPVISTIAQLMRRSHCIAAAKPCGLARAAA